MQRAKIRKMNSQCGASLLELTCAVFVLLTGAMGALHMQFISLSHTRIMTEYAAADRAVENEIETLRALPFAGLETGAQQAFHSETPAAMQLPNAEGSVSITPQPDAPPGLMRVTVRFSWTGENGRKVQRQVTTLIADKGRP